MKHKFSMRAMIYLCFSVFLLSNTMVKALDVQAVTSDNKVILIDKTQKLQILDDSDFFDSMKDCMPGDVITETVEIENQTNQQATFYLYATVDSMEQERNQAIEGKQYVEELMKLTHLTVLDKTNNKIIYKGPATGNPLDKIGDQEIVGSMVKNVDGNGAYGVLLGTITGKTSMMLEATVVIPGEELDNSFQDSFGYVNWVFTSTGSDPTPTPVTPTPTPPTTTPTPPTTTPTTPTTTPTQPVTPTPSESVTPTPSESITPTPEGEQPTPTITPTPTEEDEGTPTPTPTEEAVIEVDSDDTNTKGDDLPKTGAGITYIQPLLGLLVILSFGLFILDKVHKKKIKE